MTAMEIRDEFESRHDNRIRWCGLVCSISIFDGTFFVGPGEAPHIVYTLWLGVVEGPGQGARIEVQKTFYKGEEDSDIPEFTACE